MNQQDLELRMYFGGIDRAHTTMEKAESKSRADSCPYARALQQEFVLPVSEAIEKEVANSMAGAYATHKSLLKGLDYDGVATIAVRTALNSCMSNVENVHERLIGNALGKAVHSELVLAQLAEANPRLYYTLAGDLNRRMSKNVEHKVNGLRAQAKAAGVEFTEWPVGAREKVGAYLLGVLIRAGLLTMEDRVIKFGKTQYRGVFLAEPVKEKISRIKYYVAVTNPTYGPCVEPPLDWTTPTDGGFHTQKLRSARRYGLVQATSSAAEHMQTIGQDVYDAVNSLQRTAWRVNAKILDVVQSLLQEGIEVGEILSTKPKPKPDPPGWLTPDMKKEDMGTDRLSQFVAWKKMVAEWHTKRKLSMTQFGRMYSATRTAEYFRNVDAIYFVYFADYRGRLYPMTYGVNPQGSDLQKGLLTFSKGEPLDTPEAERWFLIHGSNKWGFDKGTLNERVEFTKAHCDEWCSYAEDPINNLGWTKADCPIQFLAWCMELQEFVRNPDFVSRIPISMDGSCNGLQNLSAMLRDEIGGEATNLTKSATMQDIYRRVAQSATVRMRDLAVSLPSEEEREFARKWLAHGISRSVVKRSVMTTPYGVTVLSATDYVIQDYLEKEDHPFDITDHRPAAKVLMKAVWPAIGDVVVKGRQLMDWLRKSARAIIKDRVLCGQTPVIHWVTPSGFPATQTYYEQTVIKVRTHLFGDEVIKVAVENDNPNVNAHATGVAPNFVHSMDASHLHMVASECKRRGITSLAMIHDDYGTHARHSDTLFKVIREQFVKMYDNHDPVTEFHDANPETPKPPTKGTLNIHGVLDSEFFFS